MTEFKSFILSKYLVGTWLVGFDNKRFKKLAMSVSKSVTTLDLAQVAT